jgi:hypothetical protein
LAPLLGTWILTSNVPSFIFSSEEVTIEHAAADQAAIKHTLFSMLVYVPIVCAVVQLYCWRHYSLKGVYLRQVWDAWLKSHRAHNRDAGSKAHSIWPVS